MFVAVARSVNGKIVHCVLGDDLISGLNTL